MAVSVAPLEVEIPSKGDLELCHKSLSGTPALALLHSNADLDCVGSAIALKEAYPGMTLSAPLGVSGAGNRLVAGLGLEAISESLPDEPGEWELIVVVDTSNPSQVSLPEPAGRILVIDHHQPLSGWPEGTLLINDPERTSCAEVVLDLLDYAGIEPTPVGCLGLLAGIVADTAHFRHARPGTLLTFARLLQIHDQSVRQVFELLRSDPHQELSRRVAQLKGAQRLRYYKEGDTLIALARAGAFEAATANALLGLGADVAFVASQKKRKVQLSARCHQRVVELGLNLGLLLNELADLTGLEGGGHPGAAALMGQGDAEALLNLAYRKTKEFLDQRR